MLFRDDFPSLGLIAIGAVAACTSESASTARSDGPSGRGGAQSSAGGAAMGDGGGAGLGGQATGGSGGLAEAGPNGEAGDASDAGRTSDGPPPTVTRLVAYLPDWSGSFADWATRIDFSKMTHLNLAFANPDTENAFHIGSSDSELAALVDAAHESGVKVVISIGGGGGDQGLADRYVPGNVDALIDQLDQYVSAHDFDGVDVDVEAPDRMGDRYATFVSKLVTKLRPKGKLITAAVAQWIQGGMPDSALHQFDFINVMTYSTYDAGVDDMRYYAEEKGVPKDEITLGAAFFGNCTGSCSAEYWLYKDILGAYPDAWQRDEIHDGGATITYTGEATMAKIAEFSKGYGGIMFWELSGDAPGAHSLYKVIQDTL